MKTFSLLVRLRGPWSVLAALSVLAVWLWAQPPETAPVAEASAPVAVRVAPVEYSDSPVTVRVPGVLSLAHEAALAFKVDGYVKEVNVRVGDRVEAGQRLAGLRMEEMDARLTQARSALDKARRDLARVERLQAHAVATIEHLEDARTALEQAEAAYRIADYNHRHASIVAPAAGRILRRAAEPDEYLPAGRTILAFAAEDAGWLVRVQLAARDAARLAVGDAAVVDGVPGRVAQLALAADATTRTVEAEIVLQHVPAAAWSGRVVAVELFPRPVPPRPLVPASALVEGAGGSAFVQVVDELEHNQARRVPVRLEAIDGSRVFLASDLPRSAWLVVQGAELVRDGGAIAIQP